MDKHIIQQRFWQPVYSRMAGGYDAVDWLTGSYTHRLRRHVFDYLPRQGDHGRILEIGFGTGKLHVELARRYTTAGLDLAPGMVRLTQARLARAGLRSDLCVGTAVALPWPDASFDAVVSTFALSAVADLETAVAEMVRVVRGNGRVIIVDAGEAADGNRFARALARLWEAAGDWMRDEAPLLAAHNLTVTRDEIGPWGCVHVVVGQKRDAEYTEQVGSSTEKQALG